jgi:phage gpG-like protein
MAKYPDQIKEVKLDLEGIPLSQQDEVKAEVGDLIVEKIKEFLRQGESPVNGESFDPLSKEYAAKMKGGDKTPNLLFYGDLYDSITFEPSDKGVVVGLIEASENDIGKADGHNNFSGKSKLPQRRFIPKGRQKFNDEIMAEVNDIVDKFREDAQAEQVQVQTEEGPTEVSTLLSNQSIADLLLARLLKR